MVAADHHLLEDRVLLRPRRANVATGVVGTVISLLALVVLVSSLSLLWLHGAGGRRFIARHLETAVTSQIRGQFRVASIDAISREGLRARGVTFIAPNGDVVISADQAFVEVRWRSLLDGHFVSPHATVTGGRVLLHDDAQGDLSIDVATRSRVPGHVGAPASGHAATVDLQHIDVEGITLQTTLHGIPSARVVGVRGVLQIVVREPRGDLRLSLSNLAGSAHLATPAPNDLRLTDGTFLFDGGSANRILADVRGILGGDRVRLHCAGQMRADGMNVSLRLALPHGAGPFDNMTTLLQVWVAAIESTHFDFGVSRD